MIDKLKSIISRNLINIRGFRSNRKIVIFESDDWGGIRIPNIKCIDYLRKLNIDVDKCHYMLNDTLENHNDFENIFEVLTKFRDSKNQYPKITANTIICNPDFERIEQSNFEKLFFRIKHYYLQ